MVGRRGEAPLVPPYKTGSDTSCQCRETERDGGGSGWVQSPMTSLQGQAINLVGCPTTKVTRRRPQVFEFNSRPNRRSGSPFCYA